MTDKATLRRQIEQRRRTLSPEETRAAARRIVTRFGQLEIFRQAQTVALYMPIAGEVDIEPLFEHAWQQGKTTCIPAYELQTQTYAFAAVDATTPFRTARYGIREPVQAVPVPTDSVDLMAVPGVAFDVSGNRLGRGGGYYDRLLTGFCGMSVAMAFDFQLVETVPVEPHDCPVDLIITDCRMVKGSNEH